MPIVPLPQFEADLAALHEEDRKLYESLKAPKTLVVRFGAMKLVGEFPSSGDIKPGCGSKLVVRTHRGTELGEMLASTCPNSGCSKSVSRKEMLEYIENSGGRDYPFFTDGKVLRVATPEDLDAQAKLEQSKHELRLVAKGRAQELNLPCKIVDAEPILGGERLTVFYLSEERVDFRELVRLLQQDLKIRVDMRQVGSRDEARLTADYEKCGQYCCCKNFLKVLKPVSMKSAKIQKATLDPLKISGRCGRLMCCLRYEDETYDDLRKRLPKKKTRVGTPEGDGLVLDSQILTQLVLVELDEPEADGKIRHLAIPVEELTAPVSNVAPVRAAPPFPRDGRDTRDTRGPRPGPRPEPRSESRPEGRSEPRPDSRDRRDQAQRDQAPRDQAPREQTQRDPGPRDRRDSRDPRDPRQRDQRPRESGPRDQGTRPDPRPDQRQGPRQGPPGQPRPVPPTSSPASPPTSPLDADDFHDDIETDTGDHDFGGPMNQPGPDSGPNSGPDQQGGPRKRRRRRRRRGGPPGAPPGPNPAP
ncbi:MAG: hypothetical protein JNL50_11135 [Phycisphaerae bacterium]|nr:hypothetical protein [Phycisphaerae bacterium]